MKRKSGRQAARIKKKHQTCPFGASLMHFVRISDPDICIDPVF